MRKTIVACLGVCVALLLLGCASSAERAAQAAERSRQVMAALADRHYKINVNHMHPLRGGSRPVSYSYSVEVMGDTLVSYLPYFGRVYWVPYGGGKGLNFTEVISSYEEWQKKNGLRHIEIGLKNDEDTYLYTIEVFGNGSATVDVMARQRDKISYSGELEVK